MIGTTGRHTTPTPILAAATTPDPVADDPRMLMTAGQPANSMLTASPLLIGGSG